MKYKWSKQGKRLTLTLLTHNSAGIVTLCYRDGNRMRRIEYGSLDLDQPYEIVLDLRNLSATHHIVILTTDRTYTRYIPSRYLNLGSEHD